MKIVSLAQRLRVTLDARQLTQGEAAEIIGVDPSLISKILTGAVGGVGAKNRRRLAEFLGCDPVDLAPGRRSGTRHAPHPDKHGIVVGLMAFPWRHLYVQRSLRPALLGFDFWGVTLREAGIGDPRGTPKAQRAQPCDALVAFAGNLCEPEGQPDDRYHALACNLIWARRQGIATFVFLDRLASVARPSRDDLVREDPRRGDRSVVIANEGDMDRAIKQVLVPWLQQRVHPRPRSSRDDLQTIDLSADSTSANPSD